MMNIFARFLKNESGATAIEYGLIAGLIAVVIIGAVQLVGTDLQTTFNTIQTTLNPAATTTAS
ncbi:Flp family type IVb pilin [Pelagibacterium sp. H642]|uniref:Flp family type IVb pilin n=1 Tax=Pelagibacterium sp. H642 TaxID=1881069 RepID=UPI002815266A|nr:Flp family type IVb pilin [Pelagibacterium sp. H642]WMT92957.1 Flp family type IVb pilin [Pelagibacterium sp. H642]